MEKHFINEKFSRDQFTGIELKILPFQIVIFRVDLTDTEFVDCSFTTGIAWKGVILIEPN